LRTRLTAAACLPADRERALLVGRVWSPGLEGPVVVVVREYRLLDLSPVAPTTSDLFELDDPVAAIRAAGNLREVARLDDVLANSSEADRDAAVPWLLAPCDLQAIKASGVTFVSSMLERVIEEQARGDPARAESVRRAIVTVIGDNLSLVRPGSP
jgi:fumarylacetoacetate (FAA) hydrolase family protein